MRNIHESVLNAQITMLDQEGVAWPNSAPRPHRKKIPHNRIMHNGFINTAVGLNSQATISDLINAQVSSTSSTRTVNLAQVKFFGTDEIALTYTTFDFGFTRVKTNNTCRKQRKGT